MIHSNPINLPFSQRATYILNLSFCQYIQYVLRFQPLRKTKTYRWYNLFAQQDSALGLPLSFKTLLSKISAGHQAKTIRRIFSTLLQIATNQILHTVCGFEEYWEPQDFWTQATMSLLTSENQTSFRWPGTLLKSSTLHSQTKSTLNSRANNGSIH